MDLGLSSAPADADIIKDTTEAAFMTDVVEASQSVPVIVDFWAPWCGPCKMIAPVLDELSGELAGKITIAKMDVDANKETPAKFNIRGIPTLMIFKNGQVESMKVGALSKSQLVEFINSAL